MVCWRGFLMRKNGGLPMRPLLNRQATRLQLVALTSLLTLLVAFSLMLAVAEVTLSAAASDDAVLYLPLSGRDVRRIPCELIVAEFSSSSCSQLC
jgi:hypothetical protein